ncbi:MAG TPA: hypothetical protein VMW68_08485 [Methyloceanibacter sp.]|nr:hypothetical protein [Methyloceanibacter sp.]
MGFSDTFKSVADPAGFADKGSDSGFSADEIQAIINAQAKANRVDQTTPTGSLTFSGRNRSQATLEFTPEQQALLEQQQVAQLLAGRTAESSLGDLSAGRAAVERAQFDRALGLLTPQFARQEDALRQRLANQGLPQSSEGFGNEIGRFTDSRNQALEQLALAAVAAGGAEQTRLTQQALGLLTGVQPASIPLVNAPELTVPVNQPQAQTNPLASLLPLGGAIVGGIYGGPAGAAAGGAAGSSVAGIFARQ